MQTGPIIPRAWVIELERLNAYSLPAFIAGGAVRDLILLRPHRDVDIWLPRSSESNVAQIASAFGWKTVVSDAYVNSDLLAIYEYTTNGESFNVIVANFDTRDQIVGRFDFGISRASIHLNREGSPTECEIRLDKEFCEDLAAKQFRVLHDNGAARTAARWERFKERYPDWTFVDLPCWTTVEALPVPLI